MQIEPASANNDRIIFEIFLQEDFSEYELSAIVTTLQTANRVLASPMFDWNIVSDTPGLLNGSCGTIARANPAIFDHNLGEFLIIIGGNSCTPNGWLRRVRAMQRRTRPVAILSEAATAYIRTIKTRDKPMATHWRDVLRSKRGGGLPVAYNPMRRKIGRYYNLGRDGLYDGTDNRSDCQIHGSQRNRRTCQPSSSRGNSR